MQRQHFKRAMAMFALIKAALLLPLGERQSAMDNIGPYRSRGKGRGGVIRNFYGRCTNWNGIGRADDVPWGKAAQRRAAQIAKGQLTVSNGLEVKS